MQHNLSHASQECQDFPTIKTNMKYVSIVSKAYLFNEYRCFESFWGITSQKLNCMQHNLSHVTQECQDFLTIEMKRMVGMMKLKLERASSIFIKYETLNID